MSTTAVFEWAIVGDLIIASSSDGEIPSQVWQRYAADIKEKRIRKSLSVPIGTTSLTSLQRKEASEFSKSLGVISAVVTEDKLVRGMLTALSWLGVNVKGFQWNEFDKALQFLGVAPASALEVTRIAHEVKNRVSSKVSR